MVTSKGQFPRRATQIDQLTKREHSYLTESDVCAFIGEYAAGSGLGYSETNQLIFNFKKSMDRQGETDWDYKLQAIRHVAATLEHVLRKETLDNYTFVPIPPSKVRDDPEYDDRMSQALRQIRPSKPIDMRELIVQTQSSTPAHRSVDRPGPREVRALYRLNRKLISPEPSAIVVVDDVITTGAHFKAAQSLLREQFGEVPVYGLFVARRAIPPGGQG